MPYESLHVVEVKTRKRSSFILLQGSFYHRRSYRELQPCIAVACFSSSLMKYGSGAVDKARDGCATAVPDLDTTRVVNVPTRGEIVVIVEDLFYV